MSFLLLDDDPTEDTLLLDDDPAEESLLLDNETPGTASGMLVYAVKRRRVRTG